MGHLWLLPAPEPFDSKLSARLGPEVGQGGGPEGRNRLPLPPPLPQGDSESAALSRADSPPCRAGLSRGTLHQSCPASGGPGMEGHLSASLRRGVLSFAQDKGVLIGTCLSTSISLGQYSAKQEPGLCFQSKVRGQLCPLITQHLLQRLGGGAGRYLPP